MTQDTDHSGMAALSICEALLLAMNDHELLPEHEIVGVLQDAADTHRSAGDAHAGTDDAKAHEAVAALIDRIIASGNSVRRT